MNPFDACVEETPIDWESNMAGESFQLYGEDLRCLDSGKPMMFVCEYEADIQPTIDRAKKMLEQILKNPQTQEEMCMRVKRIGDNEFIYDSNPDIDHYFETTNETDLVKIFDTFDRTNHLIKFIFSLQSKVVVGVFNHAIFDGISIMHITNKLFGRPYFPLKPIKPPDFFTKKLCLAKTILDLPNIGVSSQLSEYKQLEFPAFIKTQLSLKTIKQIKNEESVTFASVTTSKFLDNCFKSLPDTIDRLKTFVSVYIDNPNRFNNYSLIPIVVYRNKCSPKDINDLFIENQFHIFGFHGLFRTNLLTYLKSNMTNRFDPDVIFASMSNSDEAGDMKRLSVYNFSSKAKIYGSGGPTGNDNFHIQSSIQTSAVDLEKYSDSE